MMNIGKTILQLVYVLIGVYLMWVYPLKIFTSTLSRPHSVTFANVKHFYWTSALIGLAAILLLPLSYCMACLVLGILLSLKTPDIKQHSTALFLALLLSSFLGFWMHNDQNRLSLSLLATLQCLTITGFFYWMLETPPSISLSPLLSRVVRFGLFAVFTSVLTYLAFQTGTNIGIDSFYQWHHWSAYIGQAELLFHGVLPFNDIPLQYGLGPISLIALGCYADCWIAMYWISSIGVIIFILLITWLALKLSNPKQLSTIGIVLLLVILSTMIWPPYQNTILSISTFPSVTALRFLPGLLMLCLLINDPLKNKGHAHTDFLILSLWIMAFWVLCFAWSPEAGIQASVLWVPYYIWNRTQDRHGNQLLKFIFLASAELLLAFLAGVGLLSLCYFNIYAEWPQFSRYLTYLHHLPNGGEKANSNGMIWYVILCCFIWLTWASNAKNKEVQTSIWLVALLCFANFTYFLSHSHDSVIADLSPYLLLLLLAIHRNSAKGIFRSFVSILLASFIGWSTLMVGWGTLLNTAVKDIHSSPHEFFIESPAKLIGLFDSETQDPFHFLSRSEHETLKTHDLNQALSYLYKNFHESVEVLNEQFLINSNEIYPPWNGFHGPVTINPIPSIYRTPYLADTAKRLHRSGWLLYDKDFKTAAQYLSNYDSVYDRSQEIDFSTYYAIRYVPKN